MNTKEIIKFIREVRAGVETLRASSKSDFELSVVEFLEADDFNQDLERDDDDEGEQDDVDKWRICFVHEDGVTEQLQFPCSDYTSERTVEMIRRCVKIFD